MLNTGTSISSGTGGNLSREDVWTHTRRGSDKDTSCDDQYTVSQKQGPDWDLQLGVDLGEFWGEEKAVVPRKGPGQSRRCLLDRVQDEHRHHHGNDDKGRRHGG